MSGRILLADDEPDLLEPVAYALRQYGFDVVSVPDGGSAIEEARSGDYDLLICDVLMPGTLGTDVVRILRAEGDLPIILLTAKDAEVDRVLGLELGADDYVTKPFSSAELVSRVRALLRRRELDRTGAPAGTKLAVGGLTIDYARHEVELDGKSVSLTPSEFNLLSMLAESPGQVFSRTQIMERLWQAPHVGDGRAADVHVSNLRRKLERDPSRPERIVTVREFGYKLVPL
ncbi:MAG TPA: response regulator transcription factor [Gaiellaceae bacterium]|jgi:two-component system response regulator RegX3|nr:response regulator transcription factor [Gaiellaceae bacterium]